MRLRADKTIWASNETATFKFDVRNQGKHVFFTARAQETGRLEVDGVWYNWHGEVDLKSSSLPPGREYHDIPVRLGIDWNVELLPGKHTVRFVARIDDIAMKPSPKHYYVTSNPVEIETLSNRQDPAESPSPGAVFTNTAPEK